KTLPRNLARLYSGMRVTSTPSISMEPKSGFHTPAMALSKVDLPAPLPPMTVTNSPSLISRSRPLSAVLALTVPALNVFCRFVILSTFPTSIRHVLRPQGLAPGKVLAFQVRHRKEDGDNDGGEHLQIVRLQAHEDDQIVDRKSVV